MATIVPTIITGAGLPTGAGRLLTATVLTGTADTFVYDPTIPGAVLILENPTGGSLNPKITGSLASASTALPAAASINFSAGINVGTIPAGGARTMDLDAIALWLPGVISITAGTGLSCYLLTRG